MKRNRSLISLMFALLALFSGVTRARCTDLETALQALKSAREMVASAHCRIHVKSHMAQQDHYFEWWHVGSSFRVAERHADSQSGRESLMFGGERGIFNGAMRTLVRSNDEKPSQATINFEPSMAATGGLWSAGMFWLNNECNRFYDDEFSTGGRFEQISTNQDSGLIRISARMVGGNWYDIWLDPQKNGIIAKTARRSPKNPDTPSWTDEATQITEVAPGVYFPTKVVVKNNGQLTHERTITFLSVNEPIPEQSLRVRFPANTAVFDGARRVAYRVNAEEVRISPEIFIRPPIQHRSLATTTKETSSSWRTLTLIAGILAIAIAVLTARFYRIRAGQAV